MRRIEANQVARFGCRKQELQTGPDTLRPGGFVVLAAFDLLVVQIAIELPALADQRAAQQSSVIYRVFAASCVPVSSQIRGRSPTRERATKFTIAR